MDEKALNEATRVFLEAYGASAGQAPSPELAQNARALLRRAIERYLEVAGSNE